MSPAPLHKRHLPTVALAWPDQLNAVLGAIKDRWEPYQTASLDSVLDTYGERLDKLPYARTETCGLAEVQALYRACGVDTGVITVTVSEEEWRLMHDGTEAHQHQLLGKAVKTLIVALSGNICTVCGRRLVDLSPRRQ